MPPPAVPQIKKSFIDPSKPGKYTVKIGDSIRQDGTLNTEAKSLSSFRYNHKSTSVANNGKRAIVKKSSKGGNTVDLSITPSDDSESPVTYEGAQIPSKKTECVLIYDPAVGTFVLEKLTSAFTLNLTSASASSHPPLAIPTYKPGSSDEDESASEVTDGEPDTQNPYDYRHFINKEFDVPITSSRLKTDQTRKEKLEKFQEQLSGLSGSEPEPEELESSTPLYIPPSALPTQPLPSRTRPPTTKSAPRSRANAKTATPKNARNAPAIASAANSGPISLRDAVTSPALGLSASTPVLAISVGNKRKSPADESGSDESDADDESEESDEDEIGVSGELIVEDEDEEDGRGIRSRSGTAGIGSSWIGGARNTPITRPRSAAMDLSDDGDSVLPGPVRSPPRPMGMGSRGDEDEESSDEDEDEEDHHRPATVSRPHQHQQQELESAPSPGVVEDEDNMEYDLEDMIRSVLDNAGESEEADASSQGPPVSLRELSGRREEEEESSSEEE